MMPCPVVCAGRLAKHRRGGPVRGGRDMEAAYLTVPAGTAGRSAAAALEARTIRAMRDGGFPLISTADARNHRLPEALRAPGCRQRAASTPFAAK